MLKAQIPLWVTTAAFIAPLVNACQVPVFRYALERWQADAYHAVVVHHAPLTKAEKEAVAVLERNANPEFDAGANLVLHLFDASSDVSPPPRWQPPVSSFKPDDPARFLLYYPASAKTDEPLWTGTLTSENAERIVDSPLRRKIVEELLAGTSTVWLLIESGDEELDQRTHEQLRAFLKQASEETKLPDGVIPLDQVESLRSGPDEGPIDLEDVLRSSVPLKIHFSTIPVSRSDPDEEIFLSMLLNNSPRMRSIRGEPIAIPIFGRGRMLEGMIGEAITLEHVRGAASYLCAACSCQVKDENPGLDALFAVKWDDYMLGSLIIEDKALPPLEGVAELVHDGTDEEPAPKIPEKPATARTEPESSKPTGLVTTLSVLAILILGITVWGRRRT